MGYDMDLVSAEFRIREANLSAALRALKKLPDAPDSTDGDIGPISGWRQKLAEIKTLPEALELWSWEVEHDEAGSIANLRLEGGYKTYLNDEALFETLAPFVEMGSFIEMQGEDRSLWRWEFDGERVVTKEGRIVYE